MARFRTCLLIVFLVHCSIEVCSRVIDATESPSNQWSTPSVRAVKNSNSETLEDELELLNRTNVDAATENSFFSLEEDDDTVESFDDELDDIGQQRERPSEESQEEDGSNDIIVTTLVPTALTEEETRVDEPTEKIPAEPTKENPASGGGIMMSDGESRLTTRPTVSDEEDKLREWKEKSQDDRYLGVKEFKHDDYIDDEADDGDDDDFFTVREAGDAISGENVQNSSEKIVRRTKKQLKDALYESGMFGRSARNARLYINSPHEEEMLNFLIKLSRNPKGWARVTEILGKMDYDTSSRLKTALQMEAMDQQKTQKNFNLLPSRNYSPHVKENNILKSHSYRATENVKSLSPKTHPHRMPKENPFNDEHKQRAKWHTTNSKIYNNADKPPPISFAGSLHHNDLKHLNQHHAPIDTIAVDVPGTSFYANKNPSDNNKFPSLMPPHVSLNKNYANDVLPAIEHPPASLPHVSLNKNFGNGDFIPFYNQHKPNEGKFNSPKNPKQGKAKNKSPKKLKNGEKNFHNKKQKQSQKKEKMKQKQKQKSQQPPTDDIEAQLLALSNMEAKLRQQMIEKEKLRQSLRSRHRTARSTSM